MTDIEYIQAFKANDQLVITEFSRNEEQKFKRFIAHQFSIRHNEELLSDIFNEALLRLWKNIQNGKLSEQSLTSSLTTYLNGIGVHIWQETKRLYKEIIPEDDEEVEKAQQAACTRVNTADPWADKKEAIERAVDRMGKPCAPLLIAFYWKDLPHEQIATQLGYKDADSAKAQKYKCINKLKKIVK